MNDRTTVEAASCGMMSSRMFQRTRTRMWRNQWLVMKCESYTRQVDLVTITVAAGTAFGSGCHAPLLALGRLKVQAMSAEQPSRVAA